MQWSQKHKYPLLITVAAIGLALDWLTKAWAAHALKVHVPVRVIGEVLSFNLTYNKHAVWGLDPTRWLPWFPLHGFFVAFSLIAVAVLVWYYARMTREDAALLWGLALILPGALGNMVDRILFAERGVVDFIMVDLGVPPANPWPIFNFADIYVTCGVLLVIFSLFREGAAQRRMPPAAPAARHEGSAPSGETGQKTDATGG